MSSLAAAPSQPAVAADVRSKLESIRQSRACEEGRAIVLDFSAIRSRQSDRWLSRRESVWTHVERAILRGAGRDALHYRLDETRYLLAFSELGGSAAVNAGLNIMEGVLVYFLGVVSQDDHVIQMVSSIEGEAVALAPARPLEPPAFSSGSPLWSRVVKPTAAPAASIIRRSDDLPIGIAVEEVFDLRVKAVLGSRIAASVYDESGERVLTLAEIAILPAGQLMKVKTAILNAAGELLRSPAMPVVVIPQLLQGFASTSLRLATLEMIYRQAKEHRARLVFEVVGIDGGTPVSRVQEVLSLLRPVCRSVICRASATHSAVEVIREAGARGICIGSREIGGKGVRLSAGLMAFGAAAKNAAPLMMATGLDDRSQLPICTLAGYTHASIAAPSKLQAGAEHSVKAPR